MVMRSYQAPQINVKDQRQYTAPQIAGADTRPNAPIQVGDNQWVDRMLTSLGDSASKSLEKMADLEYSNQYLEGAAKAGVIQSEEELQGNPMTKDWQIAGYRDTMGKLAMADAEASFVADLPLLREKGPEELQKYLGQRRDKMTQAMSGMSREARATAAGQLLLQDRSATKQWTTEHTKFIIEQKAQAVNTQWNTSLKALNNARMQVMTAPQGEQDKLSADYNEQLRNATGTVVGSVWMDSTLPQDVKRELTSNMLQVALANDNVALYDYINTNAVPDGNGGSSTLVSRLDGKQQLELSNQYRDTMQRTNDKRSLLRFAQLADIQAQIDNNAYKGSYQELDGILTPMVLNGTIPGSKREALLNSFADHQYKSVMNSQLSDMLVRGDINGILNSNKSVLDGVNALEDVMARRGVTPQQRLGTWLSVGRNGVDQGYTKAGEFLAVSLHQIVDSADGKVLPQHIETFRTIDQARREAETAGLANTRVRLLSGLNPEDRMFAEQVFRRTDSGASVDEALQQAKKVQESESKLTPSTRAARASTTTTAVTKLVDSMEPRGMISTFWDNTKAAFGSSAAQQNLTLLPESGIGSRDGWFSHSPTVQFYMKNTKDAIQSEADDLLLLHPDANPESVVTVAKANVAARTIKLEDGPLILPKNVNLQTTFGVGPGNQAAIGKAIDGILEQHSARVNGTRWQVSFDQGRLFVQEYNNKGNALEGNRVGNGFFLEPADIRTRIKEDTDKRVEEANKIYGSGTKVSADGAEVNLYSANTAGIPAYWMYGYRQNLVEHEGVKSTPYKDASGNKDKSGNDIMTVGVGVSSHNPWYPKPGPDGKVPNKSIQESFDGASNDAAKAGAQAAKSVGRYNQHGFQLMAELAYQSGTNFMDQENKTGERYRAFAEKLKGSDVQAAQDAFKGTAAWYYSRDPENASKLTKRQRSYLELISKAMKG